MLNTVQARRGMAVAPHALAAQSALAVLREGGNAIEAMVAAAATIAVVYPHMNGIGGDAFWTIYAPGHDCSTIEACGAAVRRADRDFYRARSCQAIPPRGPLAANTVAGTISGWSLALEISDREWGGRMPLSRLLEDAIHYAESGSVLSSSQSRITRDKLGELEGVPGFATQFLVDGAAPAAGSLQQQQRLGRTLAQLARKGLDDFYRGELAAAIADELGALGSPLQRADLAAHRARRRPPLKLRHSAGTLYNTGPPTQGVVSLMLLALAERRGLDKLDPGSADYVHLLVEATKQAFLVRNAFVTDPARMKVNAQDLLDDAFLAPRAAAISMQRALAWGARPSSGDTVWLGVIDGEGRAVSFIQSLYHEFGSGVVLADTGILWQNRGCSFSLDPDSLNALEPGRLPFHTLNPALALLDDGRTMVYGTMGGDGQPQTQSTVFARHAVFGQSLQQAVSAPRWLLGRTWGQSTDTLKMESRFDPALIDELRRRGHEVEPIEPWDERVGHAGALARHASGLIEGAADPRSNGAAAGF